jgi:glyoxylase-like metal-dependent hydrolase (beta-lactamase superfamily II)
MVNFVYLIGDTKTRECVIIDPAYAVSDLLQIVEQDQMNLVGVLATHYHPDHVGGSMMGMRL